MLMVSTPHKVNLDLTKGDESIWIGTSSSNPWWTIGKCIQWVPQECGQVGLQLPTQEARPIQEFSVPSVTLLGLPFHFLEITFRYQVPSCESLL